MDSGLIKRMGYFFGGFSIGLVMLAFFLNGKKVSCAYGPEARVLKNINIKPLSVSSEAEGFISSNRIDSTELKYILRKGNVVFSKSEPRKSPCGIYYIEGILNDKESAILVENCEKRATLKSIEYLD